ncbi:DUF1289 domain-containing protein [Ferriphaselus amnicola]
MYLCVRNCCLDEHIIFIGCLRTILEIQSWDEADVRSAE